MKFVSIIIRLLNQEILFLKHENIYSISICNKLPKRCVKIECQIDFRNVFALLN